MKISKIKPVLLLAAISYILIAANYGGNNNLEILSDNNSNSNILNCPTVAGNHVPFLIDGNGELATFVFNEGLSGDGLSYETSYIIENFTIDGSTESGIEIRNTNAYLIIRNCTVLNTGTLDEEYAGIHIKYCSNIEITNCTLDNNERAIAADDNSLDITIINNTVLHSNSIGITVSGLQKKVLNNTIMYTDGTAIELWRAENNLVSGNILINNQGGMMVAYSNSNNFTENEVIGSSWGYGISLYFSNESIITRNNFINNNNGIELISSKDCTIYFNDIYGNRMTRDFEDENSINNQWDNGTIGNFWGNRYIKIYPEATNDGNFWNTPYEIGGDGLGVDNFPLANSLFPENEAPEFIDFPSSIIYSDEGYSEVNFRWTAIDVHPGTYKIEIDSTEVVSATAWTNGAAISYDIPDGLLKGNYIITIIVLDENGNIAQNTVIFTVMEIVAPQFTDVPDDFSVDEGYTGLNITWIAEDLYPATYTIELNGTEVVAATAWTSGIVIMYDIPDGLLEGDHNITIIISDESGNMAQDTVIFTVNSGRIPGFPLLNILIFISVGIFMLGRKINHRRINK